MLVGKPKSLSPIGFLTVLEESRHGLIGGYLVLNNSGRPIEFHCTAPVKPNRAQQILYGPTLKPYLYGEQIGRTLFSKATSEPLLVCTDVAPVMALREFIPSPVLFLAPDTTCRSPNQSRSNGDGSDVNNGSSDTGRLCSFQLGHYTVAVESKYRADQQLVLERWRIYEETIHLPEPFDRIKQAIDEAQKR